MAAGSKEAMLALIDKTLAEYASRSLIDAAAASDVLLDLRVAVSA